MNYPGADRNLPHLAPGILYPQALLNYGSRASVVPMIAVYNGKFQLREFASPLATTID